MPARVAIFIPSLRGGGAERAMLLFAEGLLAKGYQVDLLVAERKGALCAEVPAGVNLIDLKKPRVLFALPAIIRYLRRFQPVALYSTIIHANIIALVAASIARRLSRKVTTRVVVRESNVPKTAATTTISSRSTLWLLPKIYPLAAAVIAVSEGVRDELLALAPALKDKIHVLPTPVFSERHQGLAAETPEHPWLNARAPGAGQLCILAIGRLHRQKGFDILLQAFASLNHNLPSRLIILGEGGERSQLELLAKELGVEGRVSLPGFVENPFAYLKRADLFVLSSRYEGMPNVLIQAMACGTPVVATDCPSGPREVLRGGKLGTLVPVGDVEALAAAMAATISAPRRADVAPQVMGEYGVDLAATKYLAAIGM